MSSSEHQAVVERFLAAFRTGQLQELLEIMAPDVDGKEFKLSDYRGKVVLIDFWGHW